MDHFLNPRNVGEIPDASGVGSVGNPICGDIMKMFIKVENGVITDAKFKTYGCGAAIATSSMVTEMVKGKAIDEALNAKSTNVDAAALYEKRWRAGVGREIAKGLWLRRLYLSLSDAEMDDIGRLLDKPEMLSLVSDRGDIDFPSRLARAAFRRSPGLMKYLGKALRAKAHRGKSIR